MDPLKVENGTSHEKQKKKKVQGLVSVFNNNLKIREIRRWGGKSNRTVYV